MRKDYGHGHRYIDQNEYLMLLQKDSGGSWENRAANVAPDVAGETGQSKLNFLRCLPTLIRDWTICEPGPGECHQSRTSGGKPTFPTCSLRQMCCRLKYPVGVGLESEVQGLENDTTTAGGAVQT